MTKKKNSVMIDGKEYVLAGEKMAEQYEDMPWVVVRTYSSGVHCGYLKSKNLKDGHYEVVLLQARRLYYWDGAFTLSEVALKGVTKPDNCKFPPVIPKIELPNGIEIIEATEEAKNSLLNVTNYVY